jgi:hypothetical protein
MHRLKSFFDGWRTCWSRRKNSRRDDPHRSAPALQLALTAYPRASKITQCGYQIPTSSLGRLSRLPPEIRNIIYSLCDDFQNYEVSLFPQRQFRTRNIVRPKDLTHPPFTQACRKLRIETLTFCESLSEHSWHFEINDATWQRFQNWVVAFGHRPLSMEKIKIILIGKMIPSSISSSISE